jgi:toxin-antitoxin system PIN domain toxin
MKLLDANILLYAYDVTSDHHEVCRQWLEDTLQADEPVGLPWQTLLAFIRISTSSRAFRSPLKVLQATEVVAQWLARPQVVVVEPGERFWAIFTDLVKSAQISGPLVTDAALASMALEQGATLCSTDRDFTRFESLQRFDPTNTRREA